MVERLTPLLEERQQDKVCHLSKRCKDGVCSHEHDSVFNDRCYKIEGKVGPFSYYFNPLTTITSAVVIWAFVIWCISKPLDSYNEITRWKSWVTERWTWLYIGTQDIWALFIIVIYFSKYSAMKLGKEDEKPEFSDGSYFTMLFAAGIGIGLFYFGVAEPVYHYAPTRKDRNRYWGRYSDNERAQDAINVTFFHWGLHGWIVYVLIGLLLGFLCYRKNLPMTMRTCFYPLLGDRVFGLIGDLIDIMSIICTMFGVCTSLGLGVIQLNSGLHRIHSGIEESENNQLIIIWVVTFVATASVISGVKVGIRRLSELCFTVGCFILLFVLFADDTWFLMNLFVQSCGYYMQNLLQLGFHTDAFAMKADAPDGKQAPEWMDAWTIFYWGWWISWAPFVGMFIAKISRGRTIKEFITYTLTVPILYTFLWLTVFGGAGLSMERKAEKMNITCDMYNTTIYPELGATNIKLTYGVHRLSCRQSTDMWFDVVEQYGQLGTTLSLISIFAIIMYFITSSDSGSLVIDCLSANGNPEPPVLQRIFWAFTEGATATALLKAGGKDALYALQTASVTAGLPYTFLLNFACVALWRTLQIEAGDLLPDEGMWTMSIFDCFSNAPRVKMTVISLFAPWYLLAKISCRGKARRRVWFSINAFVYAFLFYGGLALLSCERFVDGISYIGWVVLLLFFGYASSLRGRVREKYKLQGNIFEDFFCFCLVFPCAVVQLYEQLEHELSKQQEKEAGDANTQV